MTPLNLQLLYHSIFNTQLDVRKWFEKDFLSSSRVLGVRDLSPQQSFQVVEDQRVLHVHLSSVPLQSHTGVQLPLQFLPHCWRRPSQDVVLKCAACFRQVRLDGLLPAPLLRHVARCPAVHPVHAVRVCLALQHAHGASELVLGHDGSGVGETDLVAVGVTEVCGGEVADQEAAVRAVEDVLYQLQQTHGYLGFARPRGREPLVHGALQTARHPGHQRPWERQPVQGPVGDSLGHVQVPAVAHEARSVSTVLEQQAQQHLKEQSRDLMNLSLVFNCVSTMTSRVFLYLVHLQEGPRGASLWQRHPSVSVAIGDRQDLADEAGEVGLLSKLRLRDGEWQHRDLLFQALVCPDSRPGSIQTFLTHVPVYLEVIEDHFFELLHRCAFSGLVEHGCLPPRLRLLAQLVVQNLPQLTADDSIMVSPASCVNLVNREELEEVRTTQPWGLGTLLYV